MSESEKLSIAGLINNTLRRSIKRIIDVEWALQNEDYAREIIRIARKEGVEELSRYADRMEEIFFGKAVIPQTTPAIQSKKESFVAEDPENDAEIAAQYIGALR